MLQKIEQLEEIDNDKEFLTQESFSSELHL